MWTGDQLAAATLIVAVLALTAAILAAKYAYDQLVILREDHKRLVAELTRKPRLEIGFATGNEEDIRPVMTVSTPGDPELRITVRNAGDREARDLDLDFWMPCEVFSSTVPGIPVTQTPIDGQWHIMLHQPTLNRGAQFTVQTYLRGVSDQMTTAALPIVAAFTMADALPGRIPLEVRVPPIWKRV